MDSWFGLGPLSTQNRDLFSHLGPHEWTKAGEAKVEVACGIFVGKLSLKNSIPPHIFPSACTPWPTFIHMVTDEKKVSFHLGQSIFMFPFFLYQGIGLLIVFMLLLTLTNDGGCWGWRRMAGFCWHPKSELKKECSLKRLTQLFSTVAYWLTPAHQCTFTLSRRTPWLGVCFDPSETHVEIQLSLCYC